jgi:1,4-dihydroxy-6-naphthoate synthase
VLASRAVLLRIGHSPDPDDAFMFWALAEGHVPADGWELEWHRRDIGTLNAWAREGRLDVTAVSLHTYPFVQDEYALLSHGASMGSGYGPIVVAREPLGLDRLRNIEIAVPGASTTAFLVLRLALGDFAFRELPFDEIQEEVRSGSAEAGLLIHEGQLTYPDSGLAKCLDLGEWWLLETGLPLPLGVNVARRALGERLDEVSTLVRRSIHLGLERRDEALAFALGFGRGIDDETADRFISMYVNELTCDFGDEGRQAVTELLRRADSIGALPAPVRLDFVP